MKSKTLQESINVYINHYSKKFSTFKSNCENCSSDELLNIGLKHFNNHFHWHYTGIRKIAFKKFISLLNYPEIQTQLFSFTTFSEILMYLHLIKLTYLPKSSIGPTILYDFALMIGLKNKVYPNYVYLNNATTKNQAILILGSATFKLKSKFFPFKDYKFHHIIFKANDFPYPLCTLSPMDIENFLCVNQTINPTSQIVTCTLN